MLVSRAQASIVTHSSPDPLSADHPGGRSYWRRCTSPSRPVTTPSHVAPRLFLLLSSLRAHSSCETIQDMPTPHYPRRFLIELFRHWSSCGLREG